MNGNGSGVSVMDGKTHEIHTVYVKAFDKAATKPRARKSASS